MELRPTTCCPSEQKYAYSILHAKKKEQRESKHNDFPNHRDHILQNDTSVTTITMRDIITGEKSAANSREHNTTMKRNLQIAMSGQMSQRKLVTANEVTGGNGTKHLTTPANIRITRERKGETAE